MKMEIQPVDPEFVRVWSRVKSAPAAGASAPESPPNQPGAEWGEFLTGKIRCELQRGRDYRLLGLAAPARGSAERAKKLAAAWFFCSGERFSLHPQGKPGRYPNLGEAIRQLYQGEGHSEEDYWRAAQLCREAELQQVFTACAQLCQATRQALWETVERTWR